jgi:plasmid stability protein
VSANGRSPAELDESRVSVAQVVNIGAELRARLATVAAANQRDVTAEARHVLLDHVTNHERNPNGNPLQR